MQLLISIGFIVLLFVTLLGGYAFGSRRLGDFWLITASIVVAGIALTVFAGLIVLPFVIAFTFGYIASYMEVFALLVDVINQRVPFLAQFLKTPVLDEEERMRKAREMGKFYRLQARQKNQRFQEQIYKEQKRGVHHRRGHRYSDKKSNPYRYAKYPRDGRHEHHGHHQHEEQASAAQEQTQQQAYEQAQQQAHTQSEQQASAQPVNHANRTPEEILGLGQVFTEGELKKAFRRERARTHPDKWADKPEHIQAAMLEEQKLVNWAYDELSKVMRGG